MNDSFEYRFQPQFYDFDLLKMAHNVAYIRWLEDARSAFLEASPWPMPRLWAADLSPALTRTEIHYRKPIRLYDPVTIALAVRKAGRSSWELSFVFQGSDTAVTYAEAAQSGYFLHPSSGRPAPMPPEFMQYCRQYLTDTAGTSG